MKNAKIILSFEYKLIFDSKGITMPAPTFSDIHNRLNRLPILKDDKSLRTKLEARYGNEPGEGICHP